MKNNEAKKVEVFEDKKAQAANDILNTTKNIKRVIDINQSDIEEFKNKVIDNKSVSEGVREASKTLVANSIKNIISLEHPELYSAFDKMDYDELMSHISTKKEADSNREIAAISVPEGWVEQQAANGEVGTYSTSFEISPNSFWNNITNILNKVTVGDNMITTGESFNAYTFFKSENLESGEAKLVTQGYSLSGTCLLDQNNLVPSNTQMLRGYQASLGVFINVPSPQSVGGGTGIGLFNMYSIPINVIKLAVTEPQQFTQIVKIFYATAANTKLFTLWMITTMDFLSSINNYIIDTANTNIRDCLNGTLFPAIKIMENPTNEFNLGITTTVVTSSNTTPTQITLSNLNDSTFMSSITSSTRNSSLTSPYLVKGSPAVPRIQTSKKEDIHLIVSPEFFVGWKSGTLSELYHFEFQSLEEYVLPENVHMLYKKVSIPAGYMNTANANGNYPYNTMGTLSTRWLPANAIVLITKGSDSNNWNAQYGDVWTTDMKNEWGAGMVSTAYLHYAIYGGTIPWSNGAIFYLKNLLATKAGSSQPVMMNFTLDQEVAQPQVEPIQ